MSAAAPRQPVAATDAPPLEPGLRSRLSLMMFLQYAIWGAWLPILYPFLLGHRHFTLDQVGLILAAGAAGAILGPFIAGQVADRHVATETCLCVSHLLGAVLVWFLADVADFQTFLVLSLLYGLIYAPTLALTNSLAFHHLEDRDKDFGPIRMWGTIGWIAAGIGVGQWLAHAHTPAGAPPDVVAAAQDAGRAAAFKLSALVGVVMGLYSLTLPHTPPAREAATGNATAAALRAFRRQPLLTLILLVIPVSCIHQFYFVHTSAFLAELQRSSSAADGFAQSINTLLGVGGGGLMTIGQMTEIAALGAIPLVAGAVSRKTLLGIGLAAYAARMAVFAFAHSMPAIVLGVALHGLCFGCFIFVGFMVVDEETTPDIRASAQSLFNLVYVGVGLIAGSWLATSVVGSWAATGPGGAMDYSRLFAVPMWAALACLVALLAFYPGGRRPRAAIAREARA